MHSRISSLLWVAVGSTFLISLAAAQSSDDFEGLKAEVQALRAGQLQMQTDLAEIRRLLEQGARPAAPAAQAFQPTDVEIGNSAVKGSKDAQITLIGFSDYQCPFCGRHAKTVLPELLENYVDSGIVKLVMRENPIQSIHPQATNASMAALCAGEQGKYWEMHDILFSDQRRLTVPDLKEHAATLGLLEAPFATCLDGKKYANQIRTDLAEGAKLGISGTPSFVLGLTNENDPDKVRVTKYIRGAKPYATFEQAIDELLASVE